MVLGTRLATKFEQVPSTSMFGLMGFVGLVDLLGLVGLGAWVFSNGSMVCDDQKTVDDPQVFDVTSNESNEIQKSTVILTSSMVL